MKSSHLVRTTMLQKFIRAPKMQRRTETLDAAFKKGISEFKTTGSW